MNPKSFVYAFTGVALGIFSLIVAWAAVRQGWFAPSETYFAKFHSGEGLFVGTPVSISGLKAGQVSAVELDARGEVLVTLTVRKKFADHIRADSRVMLGRPFIIGEKAISITAGTPGRAQLLPRTTLVGEESLEITDLLSGGRLSPYFQTFSKLMDQLRLVIEGDGTRDSVDLVGVYRQAYRTLRSLDGVSQDLHLIRTDFATAPATKRLVQQLADSTQNLGAVLAQSEKALPAITNMVPELNKTLAETVFTLQALQRSFILSGGVDRLKKEQAKRAEDSSRTPASVPQP